MMQSRKWFAGLTGVALCLACGVLYLSALDEDALIVNEELLVEEALNGELPADDAPAVEDMPGVEAVDLGNLVVEDPAVGDLFPEKGADAAADPEPEAVEAPAVEEPLLDIPALPAVDEDVAEAEPALPEVEPVLEAVEAPAAEEPLLDIPALPAVDEDVAEAEPALPEAEPVEAIPGLDDLLGVDLVADPEPAAVLEAPPEREREEIADEPRMEEVAPVDPDEVEAVALREWVEPLPSAPVEEAGREQTVELLSGAELLRRQAYEKHARENLDAALAALRQRKFAEASRLFEEALKAYNRAGARDATERDRRRAREGWGETFYRWAEALLAAGDYDGAEQRANVALTHGHRRAGRLLERIRTARITPEEPVVVRPPAPWDDEEFLEKEQNIADRLRLGRQYFLAGDLEEARKMFESVLKRDPNNTEAIRLLGKVGRRKMDVASAELRTTHANMITAVRQAWNPRDYAIDEDKDLFGEWAAHQRKRSEEESERLRIMNKMEQITIPELDFRQANIHDVISFLQDASVEFDTEAKEGERRGVNLILNLQMPGARPAAPARRRTDDPFAAPLGLDFEDGATDVPLVTFSARYISLLEALRIVTQVANLQWRVQGSVVMILHAAAPVGEIIIRTYNVLPSFLERIGTIGSELGARGDRGGDFLALEATAAQPQRQDWKQFFSELGVQWPETSSIKYVSAIGKLVVANTEANLMQFERILAELNVVPHQIEIEARFVEVSQTDLTSAGFEWLLTDDWVLAQMRGQRDIPMSRRQRIVMHQNSAQGGLTRGNRFVSDGVTAELPGSAGAGPGSSTVGVRDDILAISSVLTSPEIGMILHALEQKGNADLLSAPKVTTQSGAEATIKVVTEYIYPTDFQVTPVTAELPGGGSQIIGGVVEPSGFETREVGVILSVLPEVSPEGQMINLTMTPEVVTEPVWRNYGTVYTDPAGNLQQLNMEQPFFHARTISTSISIYNGATVVMGGMISEVRNAVDDKIPLLGDIPLLGRLFRSRYEKSEKRNLLIFVTARLVDPAGRPVDRATDTIAQSLAEGVVD